VSSPPFVTAQHTSPRAGALDAIRGWGEARDWRGFDPYDALASPLLARATRSSALARRVVTQANKLSPVNLRVPLLIRQRHNSATAALVASGYLHLEHAGDQTAAAPARRWLDWLKANAVESPSGLAWGYDFDVQTRFFFYPAGTPNTIATCFALRALLAAPSEDGWEDVIAAGSRYLLERLFVDDPSTPYFRYLEQSSALIHNANVMSAALIGEVAFKTGDVRLERLAARALTTTLRAQQPDGSWPYAEIAGQRWIDNFHTAYILEALARVEHLSPAVAPAIERGVVFWERHLFAPDGTPKYWPHSRWPLDAQCFAQAIDTWLAVARIAPHGSSAARRTADAFVRQMVRPSGLVVFQRRPYWTAAPPVTRWTAAPAFRALAHLADASSAG
jgi:hypothetical protein